MDEVKKKRAARKDTGVRVTVRLTPHEAATLMRLRTEGREGKQPRTATEILTRVLREADRKEILATPPEERVKVVGG